jgi:protein-S-isoprenylcysteine O-methyltransferase Ste14
VALQWNADHHFAGPELLAPPWTYLGIVPFLVGSVLPLWAAGLFKRAGTGVVPFSKTTALVVTGPYRFTRNPMYLGLLLVVLGIAMWLGTLVPFLVVPVLGVALQKGFIEKEERLLEEQFGDEYRAFRARVRRWI